MYPVVMKKKLSLKESEISTYLRQNNVGSIQKRIALLYTLKIDSGYFYLPSAYLLILLLHLQRASSFFFVPTLALPFNFR